ncbi:MAG: hypothetical protein C0625_14580 [Arcobacter sp.]|nr:MAG: hypothetical protein C0625_14580 [Arcobacter sp.]
MLREKNISKIILLLPIFFTVIATFSTLYIAISFLNEHFKYDVQILEKKELQLQKQDLKNKIDNVYNYLSYKKIEAKDRLKERLKSRVHMAHEFISRIYDEKKDLLSEQELRRYILETLRKIRFEKDGYFFV